MRKVTVQFTTDRFTKNQLAGFAAQYGITADIKEEGPKYDLGPVEDALAKVEAKVRAAREQLNQGKANPDAITDAHVAAYEALVAETYTCTEELLSAVEDLLA